MAAKEGELYNDPMFDGLDDDVAETAVVKAVVTGDIEACKDPSGGFAEGIERLKKSSGWVFPQVKVCMADFDV